MNHLRTGSKPSRGKNDCKLKLALLLAVVVRFLAVKYSDALLRTASPFWLIFLNIFFCVSNSQFISCSLFHFHFWFSIYLPHIILVCYVRFSFLLALLPPLSLSPSQFHSLSLSLALCRTFSIIALFDSPRHSKLRDVTCFK